MDREIEKDRLFAERYAVLYQFLRADVHLANDLGVTKDRAQEILDEFMSFFPALKEYPIK